MAALPVLHHDRKGCICLNASYARFVVDWSAVVRIDQRKIPKFSPLIEVWNAGQGALENSSRDADKNATNSKPFHEWPKYFHEATVRVEKLRRLFDECLFIAGV